MTGWLLFAATLGAVALLVRSSLPERVAAGLILAYWAASLAVVLLHVQDADLGFALIDFALFVAFWAVAEWRPRWWLTAAAGFQLVAVVTHTLPWFFPEAFLWAAITIRLASWGLVLAACYSGAWEARLDRRHSLQGS